MIKCLINGVKIGIQFVLLKKTRLSDDDLSK